MATAVVVTGVVVGDADRDKAQLVGTQAATVMVVGGMVVVTAGGRAVSMETAPRAVLREALMAVSHKEAWEAAWAAAEAALGVA